MAGESVANFWLTGGQRITLSPAEALRAYIEDETEALEAHRQGLVLVYNHSKLRPLMSKAPRWLNPAERRQLYAVELRHGNFLVLDDAVEHELQRAAYDDVLPALDLGYPTLESLMLLWMFGYDDQGQLAGGFTEDAADRRRWQQAWKQCNAYSAIPYMLKKLDRFRPFAEDPVVAARAAATLAHRRYEHAFGRLGFLPFWGLALIVLLAGGPLRDRLLADLEPLCHVERPPTDHGAAYVPSILSRCVAATSPAP